MDPEKIRKIQAILPSKKFVWVIGICVVVILFILSTGSFLGSKNSFQRKLPPVSAEATGTIGDLVSRDSNNNGITDWEESLWGLDPKGDGPANKKIIDDKKVANNIATPEKVEGATPTEQFSQDLLATILALQQSGTLTPAAISNIAISVGDSIDSKHVTSTIYSKDDLKYAKGSEMTIKGNYIINLKKAVNGHKNSGMGTELAIISGGLGSQGKDSLSKLLPIAEAYTKLSKQIMAIPAPVDIADEIIDLANANAKMGAALLQVQDFYTDIISGMVGLDDYIKASEASDEATKNIADYLSS